MTFVSIRLAHFETISKESVHWRGQRGISYFLGFSRLRSTQGDGEGR